MKIKMTTELYERILEDVAEAERKKAALELWDHLVGFMDSYWGCKLKPSDNMDAELYTYLDIFAILGFDLEWDREGYADPFSKITIFYVRRLALSREGSVIAITSGIPEWARG